MRISEELAAELSVFRKRWSGRKLGIRFIRAWWRLADVFGLNHSPLVGETIASLGSSGASAEATLEPTGSARTFTVTDAKLPPRTERARLLKELGKAGINSKNIDWISQDVGSG